MPDDQVQQITDSIVTNASTKAKSVVVDGTAVTEQNIESQIAAANFVASQKAAKKPAFGLRFTKLIPPSGG